MSVITDAIRAYRSKEITMEEAREQLRQFTMHVPERGPYDQFDHAPGGDDYDGTYLELYVASMTENLTPSEYMMFVESLNAQTGKGQVSKPVPTHTTDKEPVHLPANLVGMKLTVVARPEEHLAEEDYDDMAVASVIEAVAQRDDFVENHRNDLGEKTPSIDAPSAGPTPTESERR